MALQNFGKLIEQLRAGTDLTQAEASDLVRRLQLVIDVKAHDPEELTEAGVVAWSGGQTIAAAGAGTRSQLGLLNISGGTTPPNDRPAVSVLKQLSLVNTTGVLAERRRTVGGGLGANAALFLNDTRVGKSGQSNQASINTVMTSSQLALPGTSTFAGFSGSVPANTTLIIPTLRILGPQGCIAWDMSADNTAITLFFEGYDVDLRTR